MSGEAEMAELFSYVKNTHFWGTSQWIILTCIPLWWHCKCWIKSLLTGMSGLRCLSLLFIALETSEQWHLLLPWGDITLNTHPLKRLISLILYFGECAALTEGFAGSLDPLCWCTQDFIIQGCHDVKPSVPTWFLSRNKGNAMVLSFVFSMILPKLCRNSGWEKGVIHEPLWITTVFIHLYNIFYLLSYYYTQGISLRDNTTLSNM